MQYMNSSFRYIGRHFWRMLLYFILPAIVLGAANSPVSLIKLLTQSDFGDLLSFDEVFLGASDLTDGWRVALVVLGFILYVVFASAAVGSIQHKMRYGEFYPVSARRFFRKVNANAIAITLGMVALMIMVELLGFFVSVFVFFWSQVMTGAAALAMSAVTVVVGSACFMIVATMFVLVIPNMTVKGYGFFTAIRRSVPVACKNFGRLLAAVVIPVIIAYLPPCLAYGFDVPGLKQVTDVLFYLFAFIYYHVLMYVAFFDIEDIEREDLKKYGERL